MSRNTNTITAVQATLPEAIPAALRTLPGEIVYPFFDWLGDWWAGRRDAPLLKAMLATDATLSITPWMRGLRSGYLTAAARDRRDTTALQAPVRDEAVAILEQLRARGDRSAAFQAAVEDAQNAPVNDQPTTSGEAHEAAEQRRRRRQREANSRISSARAHLLQHQSETDAMVARLAQLAEVYAFHEAAYGHRVEALRDFYTKRESVYVRRGLLGASRDGVPPLVPEIEVPVWPAEQFPTMAASVRA